MKRSQKSGNPATQGANRADWERVLNALEARTPSSPLASASPADDDAVNEILTRWDELAPADLERVRRHPVHGQRLRQVQRAEAWLRELAPAPDTCPSSEELYDHGRGPGSRPLDPERALEIECHLALSRVYAGCDCAALVASLGAAPPPPLESTPEEQGGVHARASGPRPLRARNFALAAAAAVLVASGLWLQRPRPLAADGGFPAYPLLRGAAEEALRFPRGPVLAAWTPELLFELAPPERATSYRVVVRRHDGSAFAGGAEVLTLAGAEPVLAATGALASGHYTWEAWTTVDGLERPLGERDFEIVQADSLRARLERLEPLERVRLLHAEGFFTDARRVARELPASPERDAYLGAHPGR